MATYPSINTYRKAIKSKYKRLKRAADTNGREASLYLATNLRLTAPRNSGKLTKSIRRRQIKNGYSVIAGYLGEDNFNVARWVNQEFDIEPQLPKGRASRLLKTPVGASIRYGQPNGVNWTAKAYPWFDSNWEKTIKRYRKGYTKVRAALRD